MKSVLFILSVIFAFVTFSCKKPEGRGGKSKISGQIWVKDYNTLNFSGSNTEKYKLKGEYPGADEDVYIIYGDDLSYGDRVRSGPEGKFEFPYLRPGDYKIYLQSRDTTRSRLLGNGFNTVDTIVSIGNKKTFDVGTLVILN